MGIPFSGAVRGESTNLAFDVGLAAAKGKPIITLHDNNLDHALKEIDQESLATCRSVEEVVAILQYVINGKLYEKNEKKQSGLDIEIFKLQ